MTLSSGPVNGDKIIFSHTHSAGVAILFNNLQGKIIKVKTDSNGHWISVVININNVLFILFNVYGYNNVPLNNKLLSEISDSLFEFKLVYPTDNIIIGGDFSMVMDHFPCKIQEFSIQFSKNVARINKRIKLCNKSEMDNETKLQILSLQSKIDDLYTQKAKGAYVRSRARWIEKGEKSNNYFSRLEKR